METPLVTILLPVFNGARYLPACLDSLTKQTYEKLEILVVDDGSTDGSAALLAACAGKDSRIRILSPGRIGLIPALNLGLQEAQGEMIARMDADDICRLDRIERQAACLAADPDLVLVGCQTVSFPQKNMSEGFVLYEQWQNTVLTPEEIAGQIFIESPFAHPAVMYCKQAVLAVGGYRDCLWPEDYDLWLRLHAQQAKMAKLPRVLLAWRMHENRLSEIHPRYSRKAFFKLKCEFIKKYIPKNVGIVGAGRSGRAWQKALRELGFAIEAFFDVDRKKIGEQIDQVMVHTYDQISRFSDLFLLVTVGTRHQRVIIRDYLNQIKRREGKDYYCVA